MCQSTCKSTRYTYNNYGKHYHWYLFTYIETATNLNRFPTTIILLRGKRAVGILLTWNGNSVQTWEPYRGYRRRYTNILCFTRMSIQPFFMGIWNFIKLIYSFFDNGLGVMNKWVLGIWFDANMIWLSFNYRILLVCCVWVKFEKRCNFAANR